MLRQGWHRGRAAAGLPTYLHHPLGPRQALAEVETRVRVRHTAFLELARRAIFGYPGSPYPELLRWAGWDQARLRAAVLDRGLEPTLAELRRDGVYVSHGEFKRQEPIRREGLLVEPDRHAFDNPLLAPGRWRTATSGTASGRRTPVPYTWDLFGEEAALECLLLESHAALNAPCALWLPALPGIAGLHNLLVHMRLRRPPERWFSQLGPRRRHAPAMRYVRALGRAFGMRVPVPERTELDEVARVVHWMADAREREGSAVLKTFASSAVRVAEAAGALGVDLGGCLILTGGEPLTESRSAYLQASGARVFARYVATETGWIAGACPRGEGPGSMHLYSDRLAMVAAREDSAGGTGPLLFTTITATGPKVLLNVDIGDAGELRRRPCTCPLGAAGLDVELSGVHGHDKVSSAGITVAAATLRSILDELVMARGGTPDSYQLWEEEDTRGNTRIVVVVSSAVGGLGEAALVAELLERLPSRGPEGELAAQLWRQSGGIEVRLGHLGLTEGGKLRVPAAPGPGAPR